jgi:hypothetical protein
MSLLKSAARDGRFPIFALADERKVHVCHSYTVMSQPLYDVVSQLVYATGRHQVSDVWIAGKAKLRDRELTGMDVDAIIANAKQWRTRIAAIDRAAL